MIPLISIKSDCYSIDIVHSHKFERKPLEHLFRFLVFASEYGKLEFVKYLIEKGANIKAKNTHGRTPLKISKRDKNKEVEKSLNQSSFEADDFYQMILKIDLQKRTRGEFRLQPSVNDELIKIIIFSRLVKMLDFGQEPLLGLSADSHWRCLLS